MEESGLARAENLRTKGVAANSGGRPAEARRLLRDALRVTSTLEAGPDVASLRCRILISSALPMFESRGLHAALEVLHEAERLSEGLDTVWPLVHSQRAALYGRSGSLLEAKRELDRAVAGIRALPPRDQAVIMLTRGTVNTHLGNLDQSHQDLVQAVSVASAHGFGELVPKAQHNLALVEYVRGDIPRALSLLADVVPAAGWVAPAIPLDHGRVLLEVGLVREAQSRLLEAEHLATEEGLRHEQGEAMVEMSRAALLLGQWDDALAYAHRAQRLFSRRGSEGWRDHAGLMALIVDVVTRRRPGVTAARARALADRFAILGARDLDAYASLLAAEAIIDAQGAEGVTAAQSLLRRSAHNSRSLSYSRRLYGQLVRAKVADAASNRPRVTRILRDAADSLAVEQGRSASLDLRAAVALHGRRLADFAIFRSMTEGSVRGVFEAIERWRAVSNRLPPVAPPDDPELAHLTSQLRQLREQERGVSAGRNRATQNIAVLERRIRERDWHGVGSQAAVPARPVSVTALQLRLAARSAALVSYFSHAGTIHAVVVTPRGSALTSLMAESEVVELVTQVRADVIAANQPRLHPAIVSSVRGSLRRRLDELDRALLVPLGLRHERLVVVPSYAVAGLPWGMLPTRVGRPTTVVRTATTWASTAFPPESTATSLYAVAGPGLALADAEVDAVAALWPAADAVHAEESTEAGLVEALRSRSVVHIAAHGEHQAENALFSSVRLSDGVLFAHELQRGGVTAEHVILSACDVGRATIRPGDEALGLTASLLALGAKNVVAAVAPVPDAVAHRVMIAYHENLVAGLDVSAALAQASLVDDLGGLFCSFGSDWSRT